MIVLIPVLLCAGFLLAYEAYALFTGSKLVTTYIRELVKAYPPAGFLIGLVIGLLSGHFFWT